MTYTEIQRAYIDALENDCHTQASQNYLKLSAQNGVTYCALGVLAEIAENLGVIVPDQQVVYVQGMKVVSYRYDGHNITLPLYLVRWSGLRSEFGGETPESNLYELTTGYTFADIARLIKKKPKNFFK